MQLHLMRRVRPWARPRLMAGLSLGAALAGVGLAAPQFTQGSLSLGTISTTATGSATVQLTNPDALPVNVERILTVGGPFTVSPSSAQLASGQAVTLQVQLQPSNNISYSGWVVASGDWGATALPLSASGDYPGTTWDSTFNLWGVALKNQLTTLVSVQTPLSYDTARLRMFSDLDNVNGVIECVYTGFTVNSWGIPDPNVMNTEHTWPQSYGAEGDARSDLHHLFPTSSWVNSSRGNLPFGIVVVSSSGYPLGGANRGINDAGVTVFEPRDQHKGDCARAVMYFALRYGNRESFLSLAGQEGVLRAWHTQDAVSTKEINRNNGIQSYQFNRNPFIDQPGLLLRMASLAGSADWPVAPAQAALAPDTLQLNCAAGVCAAQIWLANTGGTAMTITGLSSSAPSCLSLGAPPASLAPGAYVSLPVAVTGPCAGQATITVGTSVGNLTLPVFWSWTSPGLAAPSVRIEEVTGGRRLVWDAVSGATAYRVEYALSMEGPWYALGTQGSTQFLLLGEGWPSPSLFRVISIGP